MMPTGINKEVMRRRMRESPTERISNGMQIKYHRYLSKHMCKVIEQENLRWVPRILMVHNFRHGRSAAMACLQRREDFAVPSLQNLHRIIHVYKIKHIH